MLFFNRELLMNEIVKICQKHGELKIDQVKQESTNGGVSFYLRCKLCKEESIEKAKEKRIAYSREYEKTKRKRPDDHYEKIVKPKSKEWRRKNKDLVNSRIANDKILNREKYRQMQTNSRNKKIEKYRTRDILKKFKGLITFEEYSEMMIKQNNVCAICLKGEKRKSRIEGNVCRLAIDHNHETGKIRELLCHNCNQVVGHSRESIETLEKAILYLKKHQCN